MENAEWVDGPGLCSWLERNHYVPEGKVRATLPPSTARRWSEWRKGGMASFYAVEKMMIHLGLHPTMIPEELFREQTQSPIKGRPPIEISDAKRAYMDELIQNDAHPRWIAIHLEVPISYIYERRERMRNGHQTEGQGA